MKLFMTGFLQVLLVTANTYFITNLYWIGIIICSFSISFIWCFNVGRISKGLMSEKLSYSFGAMFGAIVGVLISSTIVNL